MINGMEWSRIKWSKGVQWNRDSTQLFGYSKIEWNKITTTIKEEKNEMKRILCHNKER